MQMRLWFQRGCPASLYLAKVLHCGILNALMSSSTDCTSTARLRMMMTGLRTESPDESASETDTNKAELPHPARKVRTVEHQRRARQVTSAMVARRPHHLSSAGPRLCRLSGSALAQLPPCLTSGNLRALDPALTNNAHLKSGRHLTSGREFDGAGNN